LKKNNYPAKVRDPVIEKIMATIGGMSWNEKATQIPEQMAESS
jgi:hypothetical protein